MGHLMLKRRVGESVIVGDDVVITVVEIRGFSVRLSVQAPDQLAIVRTELLAPEGEDASCDGEG